MGNYIEYDSMKRNKRIARLMIAVACIMFVVTCFHFSKLNVVIIIVALVMSAIFESKFNNQFRNQIMLPVIRGVFPDSNFETSIIDGALTDEFHRVGMIEKAEKESITNYLTINVDGKVLKEFTCVEYYDDSDSTIYTHIGTEVSYDYETNIDGVVRILSSKQRKITKTEKTFISKKCALTPAKIETGEVEFDESFEVYASNEHLGFYVLDAAVIEKLLSFRKEYGDFGMAITKDMLYISFPGKDKFIHIPKKPSEIDEKMFYKAREEIGVLIQMLNDIGYAISKHVEKEKILKVRDI